MTKQSFIANFELEKKIKKIEILKGMSFEDWFLNKIKEDLSSNGIISSIKLYLKYRELYSNKKTNEKQNIHEDNDFKFFLNLYEKRTNRLEQEIEKFYEDLKYFCEIPNLPFKEWLNTYYVPILKSLPEEVLNSQYKEWRLLRVEVFNGNLDEKEFLKIMKCNPTEGYQSKDYIEYDYKTYLETQVTNPTTTWIE